MRVAEALGTLRRVFFAVALPIVVVNVGAGCGAMFNQETAVVPIQVNPSGARVYVDGQLVGQAPLNVRMSNKAPHTIDVEADGYERQTTHVDSQVSGGYILADCIFLVFLIIPGIIALAIDGGTGDWKVIDRNHLEFGLHPARVQQNVPRPTYALPPVPPSPAVPAIPQTPPAPAAPSPASPPSGCQYDTQCKGDRVCINGTCIPPPGTPPVPTKTPDRSIAPSE